MSDYAIFFDYNKTTYRLPVNPEEIEVTSVQAIEKYEVLKLGQIAIPTYMELHGYSFNCELPCSPLAYVETSGKFESADFYLALFNSWREALVPVRFIATNDGGTSYEINTLVLFEEITITEKAGEEGDKYVSFKLIEYREYSKKTAVVIKSGSDANTATTVKTPSSPAVNPKSSGVYVVKPGDCLWSIAKAYYGSGALYMKLVNANKGIIKNPALIYPGQKLVIPA